MIYLILSVVCSTLIFMIFKAFGRYQVSNLQAIVANYAVAGTLGWLPVFGFSATDSGVLSWSAWPLLIGTLFIGLFQLMARITQNFGVNVVSVTVKMSVIIPILFGVLLFKEELSIYNILGVAAALLAVYSINRKNGSGNTTNGSLTGIVILFTGSGILDALMKVVQTHVVTDSTLAQFTGTSFAVAGILGFLYLLFIIYIRKTETWSLKSALWGIVLGIPNFGSIYFLLRALEGEWPSAVVFPINNVGIVGLSALIAFLFYNEKFTRRKVVGLILAIAAIFLLSHQA